MTDQVDNTIMEDQAEDHVENQVEQVKDFGIEDQVDDSYRRGWKVSREQIERAARERLMPGGNTTDEAGRPLLTTTLTLPMDEQYSMKHGQRGECLIFVHETYLPGMEVSKRDSADYDAKICQKAFQKLGFEVRVLKDRTKNEFAVELKEASKRDHSKCDAFVLVFMSHGSAKNGEEILYLRDGYVRTEELWKYFSTDMCPTLAGKPKLFFIQACRGEKTDVGVGLRVSTDGPKVPQDTCYALPTHADILVMWASYTGMYAFKTTRNGLNGSVFIHYLAKVLKEDGFRLTLSELLLKVARSVAVEYQSSVCGTRLHNNKQLPYTTSTLLRTLRFPPL